LKNALIRWNADAPGYARIFSYCRVVAFPLTSLRKVDIAASYELALKCEEVII